MAAASGSADGHAPQNALLLLHGRGGDEAPFARLGARMELPQTATIALRAPVELPFDLGHTWLEDLDEHFEVIPPDAPHVARSARLRAAADFLWSFVQTLHDTYAWPYERVFVLGFSQGACVAFDMLLGSVPASVRLGGVVLIAGGLVAGPHAATYAHREPDAAETPVLLVRGGRDDVYPAALSAQTDELFKRAFRKKASALVATVVVRNKRHEMIASADEMRQLMTFFSQTLYLKNMALEKRSDIVEIVQ
ncbi:hypothetical protein PybrP1_009549 [[Pythium] brassicae (nom. inval.)]|nr:hypothetical protein PybrP1_009549 [[Pythium] brassicae (nom. inval.)]